MAEAKKVAILCVSRRMFQYWISENSEPNIDYFHVNKIDDVCGMRFHEIIKAFDWYDIQDIDRLLEITQSRLYESII